MRSLKRSIPLVMIILAVSLLSTFAVTSCSSDQPTQTGVPEMDAVENLLKLPMVRQATSYTCGVASMMSVLDYFGMPTREDLLGKELGSGEAWGTDYRRIVEYARQAGLTVEAMEGMTQETLERYIDEGKPVQCAIQAWSDMPEHYAKEIESGHWVVAIGYDAERIYFMDPSTIGHYTYIPRSELDARWHDHTQEGQVLEQFGIAFGGTPDYDPQEITKLE